MLVKPPTDIHVVLPPIGLGYLSAYIKNKIPGIDLRILDCHRLHYNDERFKEYILDHKPDIIGITAMSLEIESALRLCFIAKQVLEGVTTVIGGAHASAAAEQLLANNCLDHAFVAEAEIGFTHFLEHFDSPLRLTAPGLAYRDQGRIVTNPPALIEDLDTIPFPDYEGMEFHKYPKMYFMKRMPAASIISSRGCPFQCTFCAGHKVSGRKWRARSVANILAEIVYLRKAYKIREVDFWDDNFTLSRQRLEEFCRAMKREHKDLIWWCPNGVHISTLNKELLAEMKASGCYAIGFGIESASEKIQRDMRKMLSFDKLEELVKAAYKLGMRTQGFFIIGYPTETEEDIRKTIEISRRLPFIRASFFLFQPIVGSEIYHHLTECGLLDYNTAKVCDYSKASVPTEHIRDLARLKQLQRDAILRFYLRPRIALRLIWDNISFSQIKELFKIIGTYVLKR